MIYTCNLSFGEVEAGRLGNLGQPGLRETFARVLVSVHRHSVQTRVVFGSPVLYKGSLGDTQVDKMLAAIA